jgi:hypothetical protein
MMPPLLLLLLLLLQLAVHAGPTTEPPVLHLTCSPNSHNDLQLLL